MLTNTSQSYGVISRLFHWSMGLLIIALLAVGLYMTDLEASPFKFALYGYHKAFGAVVLMLAALRVVWWLREVKPDIEKTIPEPLAPFVSWGHTFLYAFMVVMPLSGWIFSNAAGYPVSVFGWFDLPMLVAKNEGLKHAFKEVHETAGDILIILLVLHVGAALVHHVYYKDRTLKKMIGR